MCVCTCCVIGALVSLDSNNYFKHVSDIYKVNGQKWVKNQTK